MGDSVISFRIDDGLKAKVKGWASEEHRTLANFMEVLLRREEVIREGEGVTLERIEGKLDRLLWGLDRERDRLLAKEERKKDQSKRTNLFELELFDGLDRASWHRWLKYRIEHLKMPLRYETALLTLDRLKNLDQEGYDVGALIDHSISCGWLNINVPYEAIREVKGS